MRAPREHLDEKLHALRIVLPSLSTGAGSARQHEEFAKAANALLRQCEPEDRTYLLARLGEIGQAMGIPEGALEGIG
ncbi:MAG: hypothetical protein ABWY48_11075 [Pseudoxanthomonas sp.]